MSCHLIFLDVIDLILFSEKKKVEAPYCANLPMTSETFYNILPFISGDRLLQPQHKDAPCHGDSDQLNLILMNYGV